MRIYKGRSDQAVVDWQWHEPSLRNITHLVLKHVPAGGGRALDVGCGTGRVAFALAARGYRVEGVDVEDRAIRLAQELAATNGARCSFRTVDFARPGAVPAEAFDLAVCSEVLEHVEDYGPLVENIYQAMKPDARLVVTVPYDPRKYSILDDYAGHVRRFTTGEMAEALAKFRLRKLLVTGFPFYRLLTRAYLEKLSVLNQEHSNEILWGKRSTRIVSSVLYPFMRIDNVFAFTRRGDAMVVVADK